MDRLFRVFVRFLLEISPTPELKCIFHYSSLFVSDHGPMICVRYESDHAELFLSMFCCESPVMVLLQVPAAPQR